MLGALRNLLQKLTGTSAALTNLSLAPDGFVVLRNGEHLASVRWGDVGEITAYRYNGPRSDMITIVFHTLDDLSWVQVKEEWPGWSTVVQGMLQAFPSIPRDWSLALKGPPVYPAAPRITRLFARK